MDVATVTVSPVLRTFVAILVGVAAGTHAAIWGMYKDAIHEGFARSRFARSVVIGAFVAPLLHWAFGLNAFDPHAAVVLFGLTYAVERGAVEGWKLFLRTEDQSKYFIPMQFSVGGVPVESRGVRLAVGLLCAGVVTMCLVPLVVLDMRAAAAPGLVFAGTAGLIVGSLTAIGGAWKDAPKEGFETLKFFRSPLMTASLAVAMSAFTDSRLLLIVAALGYERACVETYKKFFFPTRPPGKFAGKPVLFPEMLERRRAFVPVYAAIWFGVLLLAAGRPW